MRRRRWVFPALPDDFWLGVGLIWLVGGMIVGVTIMIATAKGPHLQHATTGEISLSSFENTVDTTLLIERNAEHKDDPERGV